jgi:hypothetical protein
MTSIKERTEIARENKRDIPSILEEIKTLATMSNDTALSCFYVVFNPQDNKPFVGISVRFAEIITSCWGNIHAGSKITQNNGMSVTVQGFVHDFEKNAVFTVEVQRSLGKLSSEKAIQATNAASSIAFRNAIFKAIPAAITRSVAIEIKKYIVENVDGVQLSRDLISYFNSKGITKADIEKVIGTNMEYIDAEKLFMLMGLRNAIEEGDTTIAEVFGKGEVSKPLRSSKFNMSVDEDEDIELIDPVTEETTVIGKKESNSLKSGLSHLADEQPTVEEEVIEDKPKEEEKPQKRKRGRPRKDKGTNQKP